MTRDLRDFVGNPEAYAGQNADGSYTPIRSTLTDEELQRHARGQDTLGTYVVWYDKARFFVFDIDDRDLQLARRLSDECEARGLSAGIEFSGRKGFHVWVLFDGWMEAADMQRLAKDIAATVGFNGEVFPKQGSARDLGSLVKLPLGKHAVTGADSRFLKEPQVNTTTRFSEVFDKLPAPVVQQPKGGGPLPCLDSIQSNPPANGERNNLYFHFAAHMRRMGLHEDAIAAVLTDMWLDPDPGEIEELVRNSEFSGPTCDSVPDERHCGEACIKQRAKGLSLRPGQLRNGQEGELIVVKVGPRKGQVLDLEHPDMDQAKGTLRKGDGN